MPKVSVIIPVYGVEKYIERCARSLFEQTLDDIEYIFVDDCSQDRSIQILNQVLLKYPQRKNNVIICRHEKNLGLPVARQTGLKIASGEYIAHCDSDDWVDKNLYELLYNKALETSADVVICDVSVSDDNRVVKRMPAKSYLHKNDYILDMMYLEQPWSLWNKLIRRDIYANNITYPVNYMGEDMALTLQLLSYCKSICNLNSESSYHYYVNTNSKSRQTSMDSILDKYLMYKENYKLIKQIFIKSHNHRFALALNYIEYHHKQSLLPYIKHKGIRDLYYASFPKIELSVIFNRRVNIKCRFKAVKQLLTGFLH